MMNHYTISRSLFSIGLALLSSGCAGDETTQVDAFQLEGAWVFTYSQPQESSMQALTTGQAAVVDGCLQIGDAVVIWRDDHLSTVEEVLLRINAGETISVRVGGGGASLDEGGTVDDFPAEVLEHCSPTEIWFSGSEAPTIEEDSSSG